jgi:hypothetical protein
MLSPLFIVLHSSALAKHVPKKHACVASTERKLQTPGNGMEPTHAIVDTRRQNISVLDCCRFNVVFDMTHQMPNHSGIRNERCFKGVKNNDAHHRIVSCDGKRQTVFCGACTLFRNVNLQKQQTFVSKKNKPTEKRAKQKTKKGVSERVSKKRKRKRKRCTPDRVHMRFDFRHRPQSREQNV